MIERQTITPHPLDDCDENECYKTMMAERTVLIAAQRDAQDNLIKTIIQLSSALIALMAGFITQSKAIISASSSTVFSISLLSLSLAIICGLLENFFSSAAYNEQQKILEDYYGKYVDSFAEAKSNKFVKLTQIGAFLSFLVALVCLAVFGLLQTKGKSDVKNAATTAAAAASAPASAATRQVQRRGTGE